MTIKELIKHLESYNPDDIIAYDLWQVDDVRQTGNHYAESEVTQEQAEEVLRRMDHNKDCNVGLNWDVMNYHLSEVLAETATKRSSSMSLPLIEIDIRWEDTGEEVYGLLVSQWDGDYPDNDSDAIFYYGMTWREVQECIEAKTGPLGSEFVILAARLVEP